MAASTSFDAVGAAVGSSNPTKGSPQYGLRGAIARVGRTSRSGEGLPAVTTMAAALLISAGPVLAQCPGSLASTTFTSGQIQSLAVLQNGDVVLGGSFFRVFTNAGQLSANGVAQYNPSSGVFSSLGGGGLNFNGRATCMAVRPNGELIVGGGFSSAGGVPANRIASYNPTTGTWSPLGPGLDSEPKALVLRPGAAGDLVAAGSFFINNARSVGSYNFAGGTWSPLGSPLNGRTDGTPFALAIIPGGDLIMGGGFNFIRGTSAQNIARLTFASDTWSAIGTGLVTTVPGQSPFANALAVMPGGDVIVGGRFDVAGGIPASNIARYNPVNGAWSSLGLGTNWIVNALAVRPTGEVVVGGSFGSAGGVAVNGLAIYNPSTGLWSPLGSVSPTSSSQVFALAVLPSGDVLAGGLQDSSGTGFFSRYNFPAPAAITVQPMPSLACPNGLAAFAVSATGAGPVAYQWQIQTAPNTWIDLGSSPGSIACPSGGTSTAFVTPLNSPTVNIGAGGCPGPTPGAPTSWPIRCIITNACGSVTSNPATLTICPADFNCDGVLDPDDLSDYIGCFYSPPCSGADFNGDGITDPDDVSDYIGAFFDRC